MALASEFSSVRNGRVHVASGERRVITHNLRRRAPRRKIVKDDGFEDARAADARLPVADIGV